MHHKAVLYDNGLTLFHTTPTFNVPREQLNPLPNNKTLNLSKLKGFTHNSLNMYQNLKFDLGRVENIVGKEENAGYQHFLLFPQCFQRASSLGSLKVGIVW